MALTPGAAGGPLDIESALPPAVPVGRDSTAGVAVMAHLRRQTAALLEAYAQLGDEGSDADLASLQVDRHLV